MRNPDNIFLSVDQVAERFSVSTIRVGLDDLDAVPFGVFGRQYALGCLGRLSGYR
ncbi:MAG: hypothetical protein R6U99_11045 [Nioella sp.]|uniref:hypothetical protein n=1 Tax=Nioella halotolerans TaxID=2303578 RepID=UPI0026B28AFF